MASKTSVHDTTVPELKYQPLPHPRSIRVLQLAKGDFPDDIHCTLHIVNLDGHPQYDALSYVWGDQTNRVNITCDQARVTIGVNLAAALRRLRQPHEDITVWVDALCINQGDLDEKPTQVRIMGDVYRQAQIVKIHLGEYESWSQDALYLIRMLCGAALQTEQSQDEVKNILQAAYWRGNSDSIPANDSPKWDAFQDFFRLEYWSRMWVIQEMALATAEPMFIYGDIGFSWRGISAAAQLWHTSGLLDGRPEKDRSWTIILVDQSTDQRDRIYALYSIASDIHDNDGNPVLEPDYRATVNEVYRKAAAAIMRSEGNFDLLSCCRHRENEELYLPSWVPDWSYSATDELPDFIITNCRISHQTGLKASGDFVGMISISPDSRALYAPGMIVDKIEWTSDKLDASSFDMMPEFRTDPGKLQQLWHTVSTSLTASDHDMTDVGKTKDAFWRTLIANMDDQRQKVGPEFYIHFLSYWRLSCIANWKTERHWREHPDAQRPMFDNREVTFAARKRDLEGGRANPDEMRAIKCRFGKLLYESGGSCSAAEEGDNRFLHDENISIEMCKYCATFHDPELMRMFMPNAVPITYEDPTYDLIGKDPFIKEWFERLRGNEAFPIMVIDSEANQYAIALQRFARDRKFFLTAQGRMGIGSPEARVGDDIAVLAGSGVPFVLRKEEFVKYMIDKRNRVQGSNLMTLRDDVDYMRNAFRFIGESYVHGIMDGSAVEVDKLGVSRWEMLAIV